MEPAFFPEKVEDEFRELGWQKSKKGNYWKVFHDAVYNREPISIRAVAIPTPYKGWKKVKWYILNVDMPEQKLDHEIALHISMEYNTDVEKIQSKLE